MDHTKEMKQKRDIAEVMCKALPPIIRENKTYDEQRSKLKNEIRHYSFTALGKKYGVTDNAVRKWCVKYHLPSKARKIKAMSDEEWKKV